MTRLAQDLSIFWVESASEQPCTSIALEALAMVRPLFRCDAIFQDWQLTTHAHRCLCPVTGHTNVLATIITEVISDYGHFAMTTSKAFWMVSLSLDSRATTDNRLVAHIASRSAGLVATCTSEAALAL